MIETATVFICLLCNAVFAAYEMAFVSIPKPELKSLARAGNKNAQMLLTLREHPERALAIIQIGITLFGAIAAAVGGIGATATIAPYFMKTFGIRWIFAEIFSVLFVVVPITYLNVVIGELVPKTIALRHPKRIVIAGAELLFFAEKYLSPVVGVLELSTKLILKTFFKKSITPEVSHVTTIEIDAFSPLHQRFLLNLAAIEKKKIRDIMVPWSKVISITNSTNMHDVIQTLMSSGLTRLPVTKHQHVVGVLHSKEFLTLKESGEKDWHNLIRPIQLVRPTDSAFGVMRLFQEKRTHMAIVLSPSHEKLGIVTLDDILEQIFGTIFDEDDDGKIRRLFMSKVRSRIFNLSNSANIEKSTGEFEIDI